MPDPPSVEVSSLSLLVLVVVISCCVATLLSWIWITTSSQRTCIYCSTCSQQLGLLPDPYPVITDGVVARPWVELVHGGGGGGQASMSGASATFQRLGMRTAREGIGLEADHLETRPLSPVPGQEAGQAGSTCDGTRNGKQQIFSPASADVVARRDSVKSHALGSHLSRRTLVFPTLSAKLEKSLARADSKIVKVPIHSGQKILDKSSSLNSPSNTMLGSETDQSVEEEEQGDNVQRQVRRSVSERKEKSRYMILRIQEEMGFTSQSEDERVGPGLRQTRSRRYQTVATTDEVLQRQIQRGIEGGNFNPAFVEENPIPSNVNVSRSSIISPPVPARFHVNSPRPGYENLPTIQFAPCPDLQQAPIIQ